ncbi:MAG: transglutaminase family protein [Oscillospiraceae bacterium]|jgi:transglutaminase-like putative cysteine protease|nr:transglutaminase family protein [Oscillospiraceae bacterium]
MVTRFQYQTALTFVSPASEHRFLLKILPPSDGRQRVIDLAWSVEPQSSLWLTHDAFGNACVAGFADMPHSRFTFGISGKADISSEPYVLCQSPPPVFACPSALTRPFGALADFYAALAPGAPDGGEPLRRIEHFSHAVHSRMEYKRGVTDIATTAGEVFAMGAGVCQDYAHILLTLLRLDKTPCRYVAGLASGYGETHAWVEAWTGGRFYGVDPTRDKLADEGYIALSRGRDFNDCSVERGVYKGSCKGTQTIDLTMTASEATR